MYDAIADPYCYGGTTVLKNIPDIRDPIALNEYEAAMTAQRSDEPLPGGRFSVTHFKAIHHHLFQDVYAWAGEFRTVRLSKGASAFCYPENIEREMRELFRTFRDKRYLKGLSREAFATEAASVLSTLNAIHPFREGNGRTQTTFMALVADHAGHPFNLDKLEPEAFLEAMVASFAGDERKLVKQMLKLAEAD